MPPSLYDDEFLARHNAQRREINIRFVFALTLLGVMLWLGFFVA